MWKYHLHFIASLTIKNWSNKLCHKALGLVTEELISELIWRRHCLWKVHTSLNQTAKPSSLTESSLVRIQTIFDKQHQLREWFKSKIFRKISGPNEILLSGEKGKIFGRKNFLGLIWKIAMFFYIYLLKMICQKLTHK